MKSPAGISPAPSMGASSTRVLRVAAVTIGVWTLVGLLTTELAILAIERSGATAPRQTLLVGNLISVWLWAAFTPAMMYMSRRFPPGESAWQRWLVPHLVAVLALGAADVIFERAVEMILPFPPGTGDLITLFLRRLFPNSLCYIAVVAITGAVRYSRISRERAAATARLSGQLSEARLQTLQAQLRPHFLFNTLSMIAEQVHTDPASADRMIGRLGHMLRASLASSDRHEVTLAEELDILRSYVDIMAVRLAGRATFEINVAADCLDAAVPALLLQPLVENAYRHGIERIARSGLLSVAARRVGDVLELEIADNGAGFDPESMREGVGLRIVRERLAELYGRGGSVRLVRRPSGGAASIVRIPFTRLESEHATTPEHVFQHELAE